MKNFEQPHTTDDFVVRLKDVQSVFNCGQTAAMRKINNVRKALGKPTNVGGKCGAPPVTMRQLKNHYELYPQEK